jgi:hypothetical protein
MKFRTYLNVIAGLISIIGGIYLCINDEFKLGCLFLGVGFFSVLRGLILYKQSEKANNKSRVRY